MKTSLSFFLLFLFFSAQAQYHIDWLNAPKNPIPVKYTLNHFNLVGAVKSQHEKIGGFDVEYYFNESGRVSHTGGTFGKMEYNYDTKGFIIGQKNSNSTYTYKNNDLGFVIDEKWTNSGKSGQTIYEYNEKGLFSKKTESSSNKTTVTNFIYDDNNRIQKQESSSEGLTSQTISYTHTKEGNFLKVTVATDNVDSNDDYRVHYFDSHGEVENPILGSKPVYDSRGNKVFDHDELYNLYTNARTYSYYSETTCYTGDCVNGWGFIKSSNGNYEGFFQDGKRIGFGQFVWADGGQYIGAWANDLLEGFGMYQSTTITMYGEFKNNKLHGKGYKIYNGNTEIGIFEDGLIKEQFTYNPTGKEIGCVNGNCESKFGQLIMANGDWFEGFFQDGKMLIGEYQFANGDNYQGMIGSDGSLSGMGKLIKKNGDFYGGMFSKNVPNGKIFYRNSSGTALLIGEWEKGKFVKGL